MLVILGGLIMLVILGGLIMLVILSPLSSTLYMIFPLMVVYTFQPRILSPSLIRLLFLKCLSLLL